MEINFFVYAVLTVLFSKFVVFDIFVKLYQDGLHKIEITDEVKEMEDVEVKPKPVTKFEDKYLERVRELPNEWTFTKEEMESQENLFPEFERKMLKEFCEKRMEIDLDDPDYDAKHEEVSKTYPTDEDSIRQKVKDHIIQLRLKALTNCKVMESTPLGNVVMYYNATKEAFDYYSDNTIPYRYLEPVCRKYVITFHCRPLYVDMEHELQLEKEKLLEQQKKEKEQKEREKEEKEKGIKSEPTKKNVFAKLKSYNQPTGHVVKAAPPKNSIPVLPKVNLGLNKNSNEPVVLKNKSNMYSYLGRFSNFTATKKVDRKVVDKKLNLSFADYKKMQSAKKQ